MLERLGKRVHMIGIGGARLSALARLLVARGYRVTGSDTSNSSFVDNLRSQGIKVAIGHHRDNVGDADWVAYTTAVGLDNPELVEARGRGLPVFEGAEVLAFLMEGSDRAIAVAGTHGKTTTTAMISLALLAAGTDPTIVIGGEVDVLGGNSRAGSTGYFVAEACEFREAFLHLHPNVAVITNIDWDHPDCYPTLDAVVQSFRKFMALLPPTGRLVICGDDANAAALSLEAPCDVWSYGVGEQNRVQATDFALIPPLGQEFQCLIDGKDIGRARLAVPGQHNALNALACLSVIASLGLPLNKALAALQGFRGVKRRFEIKGQSAGVIVVDDYAHHPSAVRSTLRTAREHFHGRIWCVFQPHTYSRTRSLLGEFANSFADADHVVFTDIYAAREPDPGDVSSRLLAEAALKNHRGVHYFGDLNGVLAQLPPLLASGDLVIVMGAGDVTRLGPRLLNVLENKGEEKQRGGGT